MSHSSYTLDNANGSVAFTPSTEGASVVNINSAVDWSYNETSTTTQSNSDANPYVQATYVDDIYGIVTVNVKNIKQIQDDLKNGMSGELVVRAVLQDLGSAVDTDTTVVYTFANAVIADISSAVNHTPDSTGTITFHISDNGSDALYTTS